MMSVASNKLHKKPVVLQVVEAFGGGVFFSIAKQCRQLSNEFDFVILHGLRAETPTDFLEHFPSNTKFVSWNVGRSISPMADFKSALDLRKIVQEINPHCLHAHSSKAGALARLTFPFGRIKIYYTPRAYGFLQLTDARAKRYFYYIAEWLLGKLPHTTIACGAGELELAKRLTSKRAAVFNSICLPEIDNSVANIKKEKYFAVVSAGRIAPQKNFDLFKKIAEQCPDIHFVWVGHGLDEHKDIPINLLLTGWQKHENCLKSIASCHVYLQTSLWEGLPRTVLEAMALSMPIISSNAIGNKELIEEGKEGFVCDSIESYVDAIKTLKDNVEFREKMGSAARDKIIKEYNDENAILEWAALYREDKLPLVK